jgi:predicted glycoside hydrolase/deacetylase ChbG (UPF0249 family)
MCVTVPASVNQVRRQGNLWRARLSLGLHLNLLLQAPGTEKVHDRARAPSRQTRRVAANEVVVESTPN